MHRRSTLNTIVLTLMLLGGSAVVAQTPSPDVAAAARELVVTVRAADQLKTMMPIIMQQLKPAIVQGRPQVEKDYDAIMPLILDRMAAHSNEFVDLVAAIYARNFTAEEIREVTAFYRSPVGQKFLEKMPAVTQESFAAGQKWGQVIAGDMRTRLIEELRKRGHSI
jgi:uncharacterized protein